MCKQEEFTIWTFHHIISLAYKKPRFEEDGNIWPVMDFPCVLGGNNVSIFTVLILIEVEAKLHYLVIMSIVLFRGDLEYVSLHLSEVQTDSMKLNYVFLWIRTSVFLSHWVIEQNNSPTNLLFVLMWSFKLILRLLQTSSSFKNIFFFFKELKSIILSLKSFISLQNCCTFWVNKNFWQ